MKTMENSGMVKGLLIGIASGAAIGVAVGMLYAPHSGRITRSIIAEKFDQARYDTWKVFSKARNRGKEKVGAVKIKSAS